MLLEQVRGYRSAEADPDSSMSMSSGKIEADPEHPKIVITVHSPDLG